MAQSIQEWTSKIWGRQPLKNLKGVRPTLGRPHPFKLFKGCVPRTLLGPFLNSLSYISAICNTNGIIAKLSLKLISLRLIMT